MFIENELIPNKEKCKAWFLTKYLMSLSKKSLKILLGELKPWN